MIISRTIWSCVLQFVKFIETVQASKGKQISQSFLESTATKRELNSEYPQFYVLTVDGPYSEIEKCDDKHFGWIVDQ